MVRSLSPRSLVFKTAAYAAIAFVVAGGTATWLAFQFMEAGRSADLRHHLDPVLTYAARTLEREWDGRPLPQARLDELGGALHHRIRVVPWGDPAIPAALAAEATIVDARPPDQQPRHWARLERGGKPVAALELAPMPRGPRGPRGPFSPQMAWVWLLALGLAIVPPLYMWVLRPLREMVGVARRLASGDLETKVAIDRRDEFGDLEGAFEHLRVELQRSLQQREQLLTDVSHEIRAPLARMMIALPLLQKEGAPGPVTQIFEHELRAVDELVGEVLALARGGYRQALAQEPVDLAEVARALVAERAPFAAQHGLDLAAAGGPAPVVGDGRLLARAIGNLVDNALKYGGEGASVRVETGVVEGRAFARVADTGPGIAAEHLPHVFEPFWRPDTSRSRETGGAGLGLSIVKRIAEAHGGTATVVSPAEGGTVAEIRLPLRAGG